MFSCDFGVNFSELLKYDIIDCPIHVLFECDTVIIIQNKINIVRLHKWVIIKIHTLFLVHILVTSNIFVPVLL